MQYKWLLIDFDNTLVDFTGASQAALKHICVEHNIPYNSETTTLYKDINHEIWAQLERKEITAETLRWARFERFFNTLNIQGVNPKETSKKYLDHVILYTEAYPGVIPYLKFLREKYKITLITNGLKEVQRPRLTQLNLTSVFDSIVVSDEIGVAKPDKAFFDYAIQTLSIGCKPSEILVIGDNIVADVGGGQTMGFDTCWIANGRSHDRAIKPTFSVESFMDTFSFL